MPVDNDVISSNLTTLRAKIVEIYATLKPLENLERTFISIKTSEIRTINGAGDIVIGTKYPNRYNLTDINNDKVRQLVYEGAVKQFTALSLL